MLCANALRHVCYLHFPAPTYTVLGKSANTHAIFPNGVRIFSNGVRIFPNGVRIFSKGVRIFQNDVRIFPNGVRIRGDSGAFHVKCVSHTQQCMFKLKNASGIHDI
jgi:hypothetical protein